MKKVILESPYAGDVERNVDYAKKCVLDCLRRGESPYPSHLIFTQKDLLDDANPEERILGMQAGFAWIEKSDYTVVYTDFGISNGMKEGIRIAESFGKEIIYRILQEKS